MNTLVCCHRMMSVRGQICYLILKQACAFVSCGGVAKAFYWDTGLRNHNRSSHCLFSLSLFFFFLLLTPLFSYLTPKESVSWPLPSVKFWVTEGRIRVSNSNWKILVLAGKLKCQMWSRFENYFREHSLSPVLPSPISSPFYSPTPWPVLHKMNTGPSEMGGFCFSYSFT